MLKTLTGFGFPSEMLGLKIFVLLFTFTTVRIIECSDCPAVTEDGHYITKIDSTCYHYIETPDDQVTFASAEPDCVSRGGHLVTIKDNKTQVELVRVLQTDFQVSSHTVLIGLRRQGSEWTWVTGEKMSFENWESSIVCQDCACAKIKLMSGGAWEKINCQSSDWFTAYVCEYSPTSSGSRHNHSGHPLTKTFLSILPTFVAVAVVILCHS